MGYQRAFGASRPRQLKGMNQISQDALVRATLESMDASAPPLLSTDVPGHIGANWIKGQSQLVRGVGIVGEN